MKVKHIIIAGCALACGGAAVVWAESPEPLPNQYTYKPDNDYETITWGHRVHKNSFGFRERELPPIKLVNTYRIMVVGDSLTWGAGLAEDERYTELLQLQLQAKFPKRRIEVYNFGHCGAPTTTERDTLLRHLDGVNPDLVVIGWCMNDPQPFDPFWSKEAAERLAARRQSGLSVADDAAINWVGAIDRCYEPASAEWQAFTAALADIVKACRDRSLPPPIYALLLQGDGDFNKPDRTLAKILEWSHLADAAAEKAGFTVVRMEERFRAEGYRKRWVNPWDGHPDAKCNRIYADELADAIASLVR
jgi:lysophospholipase L1-like esterase